MDDFVFLSDPVHQEVSIEMTVSEQFRYGDDIETIFLYLLLLLIEQVVLTVTLWIRIQYMLGSNLHQDTSYSD
jgi:hypothetical protein